jgi:plastocyanin
MRVRSGLLAVVLPCLVLALHAPSAAAQDNAGSCVMTGSKGTKQDYRCRMGPVTVAPFQVLTKELIFGVPKPDVDGFVTDMSVDVVEANGKQVPINRLMLHHIVFINIGAKLGAKRDPTCGGTFEAWNSMSTLPNWGERFYAAGEERAEMKLPDGYGYPLAKDETWLMTYMFMNHRSVTDRAFVEYKLTVDTRKDVKPVEPYWLDVENCKVDPVYDVPGGGREGSTHKRRMVWTLPRAGRLVGGGGHVHGGGQALAVRRPACRNSEVYTSRPVWGGPKHPFYNVRPVLHEPGPIHMTGFYSARGVPLAAGEKVVLESRYDASQPHTRVMGIMVVFLAPDSSVTERCGAVPNDFVGLKKPKGRKSPPPFRVPIVGRRGGRAVNISAPPGKRVALGRNGTVEVGDLFFKRPNVSLPAGGKLTWRFKGPTLHNITLANGPRGFSSPNLSSGRTYSKKLSVPGTYQLFCGLHPVDMTATIKVKKSKRRRT